MSNQYRKIPKINRLPPFVLSKHKLYCLNPEWGLYDSSFKLELPNPQIVLISADECMGTSDGSPCYRKFLALSKTPKKKIITAYLAYVYTGPVKVETFKPEQKGLLKDIDMEHFDITPDRIPDRLLERHLQRISNERVLVQEGIVKLAEETFFDMLWNVEIH